MAGRNTALLFACSPEDIGWEESVPAIPGLQREVGLLHNAIVADLAERLAEQYRVALYETSDSRIDPSTAIPSKVERRLQAPGLLQRRLNEGVKEILDNGDVSSVVVFLGRNPLYPMQLLARGVELLA